MLIYHSTSNLENVGRLHVHGFQDAPFSAGDPWVWVAERPRIGCGAYQQRRCVCFELVADETMLANYFAGSDALNMWILPAYLANKFPRRLLTHREVSTVIAAFCQALRGSSERRFWEPAHEQPLPASHVG